MSKKFKTLILILFLLLILSLAGCGTGQVSVGYKLDWWIYSSRYVGIFFFLSSGLQHKDEDRLIISPKFAIDIASLIGIDYAELPIWLAIPLNLILPFQDGIQADYVWGKSTVYYITRVVDLTY